MRAHRVGQLGAAAAVALVLAACSGGDDTAETPVLDIGEQGAGTCLDVSDQLGAEVTKLPVIDCAKEHTDEIYAVVDYDEGDVFPGLEALETFADRECLTAFKDYVGAYPSDLETLALEFTYLTPTLGSWNDRDDRAVLCVLRAEDSAPLTGSMKGKGA